MSELMSAREKRIEVMKSVIKGLHEVANPNEIKEKLKRLVVQTDASEIAAMEQQLIDEGMAVDEISSMCDLHSRVLTEIAEEKCRLETTPGHPVDTFLREIEAIDAAAARIRQQFDRIENTTPGVELEAARIGLLVMVNELMDVDKHYQRKENLLFPFLEQHGITGPPKVMWAKDDEARDLLKKLQEALSLEIASPRELLAILRDVAEPTLAALEEMGRKESRILLQMCLKVLNDEEWGQVYLESPAFGWCLVEPRQGYLPSPTRTDEQALAVAARGAIVLPTGALEPAQLEALFSAIPFDLTFVDAEDRVRFFTHGPNPVFQRPATVLGRKVQHCHPPKSVHVVNRILSDFKNGRQDKAEFWIDFQGRFVLIRYFAARDRAGKYLGTLEVTQDVTGIRSLEGERRLLQHD